MIRLKYCILSLILITGLVVLLRPVREVASGLSGQQTLRAAWQKALARLPLKNSAPTSQRHTEQEHTTQDLHPGQLAKQKEQSRRVALRGERSEPHALAARGLPTARPDSDLQPSPRRWSSYRRLRRAERRRRQPVRVVIPHINVDAPVVRGVGKRALRYRAGYDPASALPGEWGNCVIAAHRNVHGWLFYRLNQVGSGTIIKLQTRQRTFTYKVALTRVVHESNTSVIGPPRSRNAAPRLTLYTCTLPHSDNRVVVVANLVNVAPSSRQASGAAGSRSNRSS